MRNVTDADPTYGLAFAARTFEKVGLGDRWVYYDAHTERWLGPCCDRVPDLCRSADLLLNLGNSNPMRPWYLQIPARALVDTDPAFTQIRNLTDPALRARALQHTVFFSFGENIAAGSSTTPGDGLCWQATRQPVVLDAWPVTPGPVHARFSTVMQWDSYAVQQYQGRRYGMKSESFQGYWELPARAGPIFELALGSGNAPFKNFNTTKDAIASITKLMGSHTAKGGFYYHHSLKPQSSFANNNGQISFANDAANPFDTGYPFANAITGVYQNYTQASGYFIGNYVYNNLEWFLQDNWKASRKLTLDYGIRFYWMQPQYDTLKQTANFIPEKFDPSKAPRLYFPGRDAAGSRVAVDRATGQILPAVYIGRLVPNSGSLQNGVFQAGQGIDRAQPPGRRRGPVVLWVTAGWD